MFVVTTATSYSRKPVFNILIFHSTCTVVHDICRLLDHVESSTKFVTQIISNIVIRLKCVGNIMAWYYIAWHGMVWTWRDRSFGLDFGICGH